MPGRAFLDTNVVVYAFARNDARAAVAERLLGAGGVISVQVLNEFASVARRKLAMAWPEVRDALAAVRALSADVVPITVALQEKALDLAERTGYGLYDALVVAASLDAGCATLYSEDMRAGHVIDGLTIVNPFAGDPGAVPA